MNADHSTETVQIISLLQETLFEPSKGSGKVTCVPGWRWDEQQAFTDFDLWYISAGKGQMTLGIHTFDVVPGDCLILRPGDKPQAKQDESDRLTVIYVHFQMKHRTAASLYPPRLVRFNDRHDIEWLLHRLVEADRNELQCSNYSTSVASFSTLEFDQLLRLFWIRILRKHERDHTPGKPLSAGHARLVKQLTKLIGDSAGQTDIATLAQQCGRSPQYLSRMFTRYTGMPLKQYIVRTKLEHAKHLLSESSLTVLQVAEALGYADEYIFGKLFKKYFGISPARYTAHTVPTGSAPGHSVESDNES